MNNKSIYIIRGIPGARKTTLANELAWHARCTMSRETGTCADAVVFSEDDYWTDENGNYNYDAATTPLAFDAMYSKARAAISHGTECIILATALLSLRTVGIVRFVEEAKDSGYAIYPLILQRDMDYPPSVHGVSDAEMDRFRCEMEHGLECSFSGTGVTHASRSAPRPIIKPKFL